MATRITTLLNAAIAMGAGGARAPRNSGKRTFQAKGSTSAGAGSASVDIEASNDEAGPWINVATVGLVLGVVETSDGFASDAMWAFVRANVTAIAGTDATVTVLMGD